MKIVFLSDDFPPTSFGGAGISTSELALGMKKAGHDVSVITTVRHTNEAGKSEYQGLTVFKIASDYDGRWRAWLSLYNPPVVRRVEELLREIQPDVVHANNIHFYLSYYCLKVAKRYAKAVVWTARDAMAFSYGKLNTPNYLDHLDARLTWRDNLRQAGWRYNPLRNFFIRRYLSCVDSKCAVSSALARAFEQNGIDGVEAIRTGMDVSDWKSEDRVSEAFCARHSLQGKNVIFFGGRLGDSKGGSQALGALALIVKEVPGTVLLVAGKREDFAGQMKKRAKDAGVEEKIVFTGWISGKDLHAAYAVANVVWAPSVYLDPLPRMVLEAMASGKPVVGTCYGGSPEVIIDGVTGYVVDPRHAEGIAAVTLDLLRDPVKARIFGEAGHERVRKHFTMDDVVRQYTERYCARQR